MERVTEVDKRTRSSYINQKEEKVENLVNDLFKEENLSKSLVTETRKSIRKKGRPKIGDSSIDSVMNAYEGERVIPIYEGFGENGGQLLLTPYEHKFVIAYAQLGEAAKAARVASNPEDRREGRNWNKVGNDLMTRPQVRSAIGYMQKKLCVAAALDSTEVISNIREIGALATIEGKYDAALKANLMLGEYLGILGKDKGIKPGDNSKTVNQIVDIFKTGEELLDNQEDIKSLGTKLGITFKDGFSAGMEPRD